jgi:hypothetical protein
MSPYPSIDILPALTHGNLELKGQFLLGSNYTFLAKVRYNGATHLAVYKPSHGEQPLWDFPEESLAGREVAAYLVSQALGFNFVPLTVLREGPFGPGSLQQFIKYDPEYNYFTFTPVDRSRLRPVALFDLLVNNADRKGSHMLIEKSTRYLWLIDHGLCFHTEDKLRTVLWDFGGEPFPAELISALQTFRNVLPANLSVDLAQYLQPNEVAALDARAEALLTTCVFPYAPAKRRAFPYPPL